MTPEKQALSWRSQLLFRYLKMLQCVKPKKQKNKLIEKYLAGKLSLGETQAIYTALELSKI